METIVVKQIDEKQVWKDENGKHSIYPRTVKTTTEFTITGNTLDDCFATYFKEYSNRYKYCNDIHFVLDAVTQMKFAKWISNVNNYARNGGDMW